MAKKMHTDMMEWSNGDLNVFYRQLVEEQGRTTAIHGIWFSALMIAAVLVAFTPQWRWHALAVGLLALERAVWHGREAATRNLLMHHVTIARWK